MARSLIEDLTYNVKWLTSLALGKGALTQVEHVVTQGPGMGVLQGMGAGTAGTAFGFVMIPAVVGVSAGLAQMEHQHHRDSLRDEFREEIAARTGKKPEEITNADMDAVAKGTNGMEPNQALKDALTHSRKERNNMVMLSIISTFVAMAATKLLTDVLLGGGAAGVAAGLGLKMAVGITTYFAVKRPLHWLASKINGLDEPTVADKVAHIERAKERGIDISQEKIFDVYLSANPELDKQIKQDYGRSFINLKRHVRADVLNDYGPLIGLQELTTAINAGVIKPTELAFAAYGQVSGVAPKSREEREAKPQTLLGKMMSICNGCLRSLTQIGHQAHLEQPHEYDEAHKVAAPLLEPATRAEVAEENVRRRHSFVEMVGRRSQAALAVSHVDRLAMQQAEGQTGPQLGG